MAASTTRRDLLKSSLVLGGLSVLGIPAWVLPALAQTETVVPFTDLPSPLNFAPAPDRRLLDVRRIDGPLTDKNEFFTTQHYGHPEVDPVSFRLKISGLVEKPLSFSLDEIRRMGGTDLVAGFECSGNRPPLQGLISNGRWSGVPLRRLLERVGVTPRANEIVFFGADHGEEEIEWRTQKFSADQRFGRSLRREHALSAEPLVAYALNGEPLSRHQGAPLRLIVPGWYGVANVKWLSHIHAQEEAYVGKYQARWYRTVRAEMIDGELTWNETAVTRMQLKSFIARVTRTAARCRILGVALSDGTPVTSAEVRIDDGPWRSARLEPSTNAKYSWKLFSYEWADATPGEHTLVSRVTDDTGKVQPTADELKTKRSFLEDNAQFPRKVVIM